MTLLNTISAHQSVYPLTVYYDHSCVLCRSEILHIKARDTRNELVLIDCSAKDFSDAGLPVTQAEMMDCIHAQDSKGQWLVATEVFVALYSVAGLNTMARVWRMGKPVAEKIYPWIVRNRYVISKLGIHHVFNAMTTRYQAKTNAALQRQAKDAMTLSQACKDGACELDSLNKPA